MARTLNSPRSSLVLAAMILGLYSIEPVVDGIYYRVGLAMGAFDTRADSIGIPLTLGWHGWLMGWPLVAALASVVVWRYRGGLSLTFVAPARPFWSSVWSLLIGVPVAWCLLTALYELRYLQFIDLCYVAAWSYVALCLRTSIVAWRV